MKACENCGKEVEEEDENYCEECAFNILKKFIKELYEKQVKDNRGKR